MNRTLRRPMFRIGGSAEGITSGLSRQGYQGTGQAWEQFVKKIPDIRAEAKKAAYQPRGTNIYDFMAPPMTAGPIFYQIMKSVLN